MKHELAIVLIGRNEKRRLGQALAAALAEEPAIVVYVDSASTDESVQIAQSFGERVLVDVLDTTVPTTAARGRNRGFQLVRERAPGVTLVQFVDGDCFLVPGWIDTARAYFAAHDDAGVVAGRLREDERDKNVYHRLADMEWNVPAGDVESTGGICMMRASAFEHAGGFDGSVAAGEELELALRIRGQGYRIVRLDHDMARHDIGMERFTQWWQRAVRAGQAYAEGLYLQSRYDQRMHTRDVLSMLAWGAGVPLVATGMALPTLGLSLGLFAGYPVLWRRVRAHRLAHGDHPEDATLYASAMILSKFAGVIGIARFAKKLARGEIQHGRFMGR